ncbi:uncharacterized protein BDW43DRAFT_282131 [Aspergillus alliaceus]|uniref:uncharacterized protein n=1 Tax=Petromyces alliaceus TaxID=209559 RepID=UPI0012A4D0C3|nr:uncharacterized protein BDW43DRAFT_282131 [Aspergillus alliaceus]KAB8231704.1 hypothetical protein BDW43DRAFT_282131 [Aspergillus alliaceus]
MNTFGRNLASTEGDDWKRHRKLNTRAFNEMMHEAVWIQSARPAFTTVKQWADA